MAPPIRRVCLFLGAGASANSGVPTTVKFVDLFREQFAKPTNAQRAPYDRKLLKPFDELIRVLRRWKRKSQSPEQWIDIETLLEALRASENLTSHVSSALLYGRPVQVVAKRKPELKRLSDLAQRFVREKCYVGSSKVAYLRPLLPFVRTNGPTHVFTVNYDMVMESWFERNSCTFTDGFDLTWNPTLFGVDTYSFYLYKLHGSVTWYRSNDGRSLKIPIRQFAPRFNLATGGWAESLMLYPAQKWINSGVYLRLLNLLHEILAEAEFVIVVGYSFRDDHFVRAFQEAAFANPKLRVVLVDPNAEMIYQDKLRYVRAPDGTGTSSALFGHVFRFPFMYEKVIDSLYTAIWTAVGKAVQEDNVARQMSESGSQPKWQDVAMCHLEAGSVDRAALLEESSIDWGASSEGYKVGFFGRKAVLEALSSTTKVPREKAAAETWEKVKVALLRRISDGLFTEIFADWMVRIAFDRSTAAKTPAEQLVSEFQPLVSFARRYQSYMTSQEGLAAELVSRIAALSNYLEPLQGIGTPLESYAASRREASPESVDELLSGVTRLKAEGKSVADGNAQFGTLILRIEQSYQRKVMPFLGLASPPVGDEGASVVPLTGSKPTTA